MEIYQRLGVPRVINALGHMTSVGTTPIPPYVTDAMVSAAQWNVDIELLHDRVGEALAKVCGTEAAMGCSCAAAGIVLSTAAAIAGTDPDKAEQLPNTDGLEARILIPAGHCVDFGAPVEQMIAMAGGKVTRVGQVNRMSADQLRAALKKGGAAFMYLASHHTVHKGILTFPEVVAIVKGEFNIPLIVDAAGDEDLLRFAAAGADCVIYSGAKAVLGPVSGLLVGKKPFIQACRAQIRGIGRPLKIGKEDLAALLVAVEHYLGGVQEEVAARRRRLNQVLLNGMKDLPHSRVEIIDDEVRIGLDRVIIKVDRAALGFTVREIFDALAHGDPPVRARGHMMNLGELGFDCRIMTEQDAHEAVRQVRAFYASRGVL